MKRCKYIITQGDIAILFDERINHSDMVSRGNCKSAGFVRFDPVGKGQPHTFENSMTGAMMPNIKIVCYGKSESLGGIQSLGDEDAKIIKEMMVLI